MFFQKELQLFRAQLRENPGFQEEPATGEESLCLTVVLCDFSSLLEIGGTDCLDKTDLRALPLLDVRPPVEKEFFEVGVHLLLLLLVQFQLGDHVLAMPPAQTGHRLRVDAGLLRDRDLCWRRACRRLAFFGARRGAGCRVQAEEADQNQ